MKLSFFLNRMGIASSRWYEENNIPFTEVWSSIESISFSGMVKTYTTHYACGRIDVYGHPEHPFNYEYGVNIMETESWYYLSDWLGRLTLNYLPDTVEEIYEMFEKETSHKIKWWNNEY